MRPAAPGICTPTPDWPATFGRTRTPFPMRRTRTGPPASAEQPEIEAYLQRCATEFGLDPHIKLNTRIRSAHFTPAGEGDSASTPVWTLESDQGERFEFDAVINAMGNQHTPLYPSAEGLETFEGPSWHATEWNHDVDLAGKRVAIIGSAASAVQIVPELAKVASHLTVLQRTPNWIMPRGRVPYSESKRAWYRRLPPLLRLTQKTQKFMMSFVHEAATLGHKRQAQFEERAKKFINEAIPDKELAEALTPKSRYACKRGLVSDDFYPALMLDHVDLIPEGLSEVRKRSIVTAGGREVEVDVIIYCTGYRILDFEPHRRAR